ncbi:bifunctional hydroxymethylpyrimidine kinase/phosphomethylpyrimidine kinase [Microbacterium sp. NPDC096154]|uniref:bifunctional hydroxymethylpyrimidine kinase/phosphomethylpyrimidine kinase n=1 Tax=Microbacterium sp. NPDC096154 TaxID=3155549 RepID=UPI0033263282
MMRVPNILSIAGSDPSGGAGIQADLKSITACGGYGMAAVAALTAQSTQGVSGVHVPPASFLRAQLDALSADIRIDAVKLGMLPTAEVIDAVAEWLDGLPARPPVVLDPVMVATSGDRLIDEAAEAALGRLIGRADVVTPNLPELAVLLGEPTAASWGDALDQARRLARAHGSEGRRLLVLAKGGHLAGDDTPDALVGADGVVDEFAGRRIRTRSTHGTGCSLSSALATLYAREGDWTAAARLARAWLRDAIEAATGLDVGGPGGHGPLHHAHALWSGRGVPRRAAELTHWWEDIAELRAAIDEVWFVRALADGTLERAAFEHYLAQDALYLHDYAEVLARAAELAPSVHERAFWSESSRRCREVELELHRAHTRRAVAASPETTAYLDHLRAAAASGDHAVLVAAVLPCFWLYDDLGARLSALDRSAHPYADWLATYGDPGFADATRRAIAFTQDAARAADDERLRRMRTAFDASCGHELAFFAQRAPAIA